MIIVIHTPAESQPQESPVMILISQGNMAILPHLLYTADCSGKTTDKFCLSVLLVFLFWTLLWPGCDALGVPVAGQWKLYRG